MDLCTDMQAFHDKLIDEVNHCGLTVGAALFIVKDVYNILYLEYLKEQQKEKITSNTVAETGVLEFDKPEIQDEEECQAFKEQKEEN